MQTELTVTNYPYIPVNNHLPTHPSLVVELPTLDPLASDEEKLIHLLKQKGAQFPDQLTLTPEKTCEIFNWLNEKYFNGNHQSLRELLAFILNNFPSAKTVYLNGSGVFPFLHQELNHYAQTYLSKEEYQRFEHLFNLSHAKPGDFDFKIICEENSKDQLKGRLLFLKDHLEKNRIPYQDKSNDRKATNQSLLGTLRLTVNVCPSFPLPYTEPKDDIQPELVFSVRTPYERIFTNELEIDLTPLILNGEQQLTVRMPCDHSFENLISGTIGLAIEKCIDEEPFLRIVMMRSLGKEVSSQEQEDKAYHAFSERNNNKLHIKSHLKKHFVNSPLMQAVYLYNMAQALLKKLPHGNLEWSLPLNKIQADSLPPLLKPLFKEGEVPFANRLAFFDFLLLFSKSFENSPERHYKTWRTYIPCPHYRAALMTSTPLEKCLPCIKQHLNSQIFAEMVSQFNFKSKPNDDWFDEINVCEPLIPLLLESPHCSLRFLGMQLAFMFQRKTGNRLFGNQEIIRFLEDVGSLSKEERLIAIGQLGSPRLLEAAKNGLDWVDVLAESEDEQEVRLAIQMDRERAAEHLNVIAKRHPLMAIPFIDNTNTDLFYKVWNRVEALPASTKRQIALFQLAQEQLKHPEQLRTCDPVYQSQFLTVLRENGLEGQAILLDINCVPSLERLKSAINNHDHSDTFSLIERFLTADRSLEELKAVQPLLPKECEPKRLKAIFTSIFHQLVLHNRLEAVRFLNDKKALFREKELQNLTNPLFEAISTGDEQLLTELFTLCPNDERMSQLALRLYSELDIDHSLNNTKLVQMMSLSDFQDLLVGHLRRLPEETAACAAIAKKLNEQKLCDKLPSPFKELFQDDTEVPFESRLAFYQFLENGQLTDPSLIQPYSNTAIFALLAEVVSPAYAENIEVCKHLVLSWLASEHLPLRLLGKHLATQIDPKEVAEHLKVIAKKQPVIAASLIDDTDSDLLYLVWNEIVTLPPSTERQNALFELAQKQLKHPERLESRNSAYRSQFLAFLRENGLEGQAILLEKNCIPSLEELKSALNNSDRDDSISLIERFLTADRSLEELTIVQTLLPKECKQKQLKTIFTSIFHKLTLIDRLEAVKFLKEKKKLYSEEEFQSFTNPLFEKISSGDEELLIELFTLSQNDKRVSPLALKLYSELDIDSCLKNTELVKMMSPSDFQELLTGHLSTLPEDPADCAVIAKKLNEQKLCGKLPSPLKELFQDSAEVPFEARLAFYRFLKSGQLTDLSLIQPYSKTAIFALLAKAILLESVECIETCKPLIQSWLGNPNHSLRLLGMRLALLYQKRLGEKLYLPEAVGRFIDDTALLSKENQQSALSLLCCDRLNKAIEKKDDWTTALAQSEVEEEVRWAAAHSKKKTLLQLRTISLNHPLLAVELYDPSALSKEEFWMLWSVLWGLQPGALRKEALQQLARKGAEIVQVLKHDSSPQLEQLTTLLKEIGLEGQAVVLSGEETLTLEQLKSGLSGTKDLDTRASLIRKFLNTPQSKSSLKEVQTLLPSSFKKKKQNELLKHYFSRLVQVDLEDAQMFLKSKKALISESERNELLCLLLSQVVHFKKEKLFFQLFQEYKDKKLFSPYALQFYRPSEDMDSSEILKKIRRYSKNNTLETVMMPVDFAELWNQLLGAHFSKQTDSQDLEETIEFAKIHRDRILKHCSSKGLPLALTGWVDAIIKITDNKYKVKNSDQQTGIEEFKKHKSNLFRDLPDPHFGNDSDLDNPKKQDHRLLFEYIKRHLNHSWSSSDAKQQMLYLALGSMLSQLKPKLYKRNVSTVAAMEEVIETCASVITKDLLISDMFTMSMAKKLLEDLQKSGKDLFSKKEIPLSLLKLHFCVVADSAELPREVKDPKSITAIEELLETAASKGPIEAVYLGLDLLFFAMDSKYYREKFNYLAYLDKLFSKFCIMQKNGAELKNLPLNLIALFEKYPEIPEMRNALSKTMYVLLNNTLTKAVGSGLEVLKKLAEVPDMLDESQFINLFRKAKQTLSSAQFNAQVPKNLLLLKSTVNEYLQKNSDKKHLEIENLLKELNSPNEPVQ